MQSARRVGMNTIKNGISFIRIVCERSESSMLLSCDYGVNNTKANCNACIVEKIIPPVCNFIIVTGRRRVLT